MDIIIFLVAVFFSINMGGSSFAASMATAVGSGVISKRAAQIWFVFLIVAGAVMFGGEVAATLSRGIIPAKMIDARAALIILSAASLSLFTANLMHIPQSTSLSTIAAICGVGAFYSSVNTQKIGFLAVCWIASVLVSFILIYWATRYMYPPKKRNFWIYEKIINHKKRLAWFIILTSLYNVFAQGTNNVANAVGPMNSMGLIDVQSGLWVMGLAFGVGAFLFTGTMKATSEKIVPLGIMTATIINFISGTISIVASIWGIPQPAVIIYTMAVLAVGMIKDGPSITVDQPMTKKMFITWIVNPLVTFAVSYFLSVLFLHKG